MEQVIKDKNLGMEFIQTTFAQSKDCDSVQWWIATIDGEYPTIKNMMNNCGGFELRRISEAVERIKNNYVYQIRMVPIKVPDEKAKYDRSFHRGYGTDDNPFIYRKKPIVDIKASCPWKIDSVFYQPCSSYNYVTVGEKRQLDFWFSSQLLPHFNEDMLNYLKRKEINLYFLRLIKAIEDLEKNTQEFKQIVLLNSNW